MYEVFPSREFEKSLNKLRRSGRFKEKNLEEVLYLLSRGEKLPVRWKDHELQGDMQTIRQCHIHGDLLLQYDRDEILKEIGLVNIGTHHELLGN